MSEIYCLLRHIIAFTEVTWFVFILFTLWMSQIGTPEALIGRKSAILRCWLVANRHFWDADWFACMWRANKTQYFYSARSCKYEMPRSEICVSRRYHVFSVPLILLTNAYTGCGRPTLNLFECFWFWFGSVRRFSLKDNSNELTSELWTNLKSELHNYAQKYSNVLRTWEPEAWQPEVRTW